MNRTCLLLSCACISCLLTAGYSADTKITRKQIPSAVLKAFENAYPHAIIKGQSIENEKGKKYYEIESID